MQNAKDSRCFESFRNSAQEAFVSSIGSEHDPSGIDHDTRDFLFPGANTTLFEFYVSYYAIKIKHKLSDLATNDILKCFKHILPKIINALNL